MQLHNRLFKFQLFPSLLIGVSLLVVLQACSSEKEIELELPVYESKMVVECYLEPGKPFRLTLTESVSYFSAPSLPTVDSALVVISYNGQTDTLENSLSIDPVGGKLFNYVDLNSTVPFVPGMEFDLFIQDRVGRIATASTQMQDTVSLYPIEFRSNAENEKGIVIKWPDFPNEDSFYFLTTYRGDNMEGPDIDFTLDDRIGDGEDFNIQTFYYLDPGDTVLVEVFKMDEAFYYYLETTGDAANANGNPFAQPTTILSNIEGGIGIFTGGSKVSRSFIVPN